MSEAMPRAMCARCRRPEVVCWCAHVPALATRTRVLILQHPRESDVGIGTARMAHLGLPSSQLRVGLDFADDPVVSALPRDSHLLFPGETASDLRAQAFAEPITLVVVDGTWSQARGLVRRNPVLAALPRIVFVPRAPSDYRIRREPADFCVSTIEALAEALEVLEGRSFAALLAPFRVMVDRQERYASEVRANRHQRRRLRQRPRTTLGERLRADWPRLVCVQGEANGWPVHHPEREPTEMVHFVACRPASGEIYEAVIAPRRRLAPATPAHVELDAARLQSGVSVETWRRGWQAFVRADDVLVQWGSFYAQLAAADGLALPARRFDLRGELAAQRRRGGTLEECVPGPIAPLGLDGRGGRRLAALVTLLRGLCAAPGEIDR